MERGNLDGMACFFVGIGGSGMMPLAMIARGRGASVAGSDRALDQGRVPAKFDALATDGVALFPQDGSGVTSPEQLVIASAAIEASVPDIVAAERLGCRRMTRAELNARLFNASAVSIGVAGTSGKSTVTGMIGWILHAAGVGPTVMNGAAMKDFGRASALVGSGDTYVSEVDESDGSIALYRPTVAVINNISLDHKSLDELRTLFAGFAAAAGQTVVNVGDAEAAALAEAIDPVRLTTVAVEADADLSARYLIPEPFAVSFTLVASPSPFGADGASSLSRREREGAAQPRKGEGGATGHRVRLQVPGRHNVANALAALAAARVAGIPLADAIAAIERFTGIARRFDLVGEADGVAVIDDFGHNPDKIAATLDTLHAFPGRLLILFQPHGYGPLRVMGDALVAMFADRLAADDVLVLPDPVYHGGTVDRSLGSAQIAARIAAAGRDAHHVADRAAAASALLDAARPGDRVVVMGARDDSLSDLARDMVEKLRQRG